MKSIILVACVIVAVASAASPPQEPPKIISYYNDQQPEGSYSFGFESENGVKRQEQAQLKEVLDEDNKPRVVLSVSGSYSYVNDEGKPEQIQYYADENGYKAEGASIPKVPARR